MISPNNYFLSLCSACCVVCIGLYAMHIMLTMQCAVIAANCVYCGGVGAQISCAVWGVLCAQCSMFYVHNVQCSMCTMFNVRAEFSVY